TTAAAAPTTAAAAPTTAAAGGATPAAGATTAAAPTTTAAAPTTAAAAPTTAAGAPTEAAAAGGTPAAASGGALQVAWARPLTGDVAQLGQGYLNGVKMAADEWNAKGGVLGQQIVIQPEDDACDPKPA